MKRKLLKIIPFFIMSSFLVTGCNQGARSTAQAVKPAVEAKAKQSQELIYKGKVAGKSNKAKSISIVVGKGKKAKTIIVKFDKNTKGIEYASKGHGAIISYEMHDNQPWATVIKPKLAKLPKGITEIKTAELKSMINANTDFMLIDARPGKRYAASHIAGAVNIGTKSYKKQAPSVLPKDKDKLLVMYCGGPT